MLKNKEKISKSLICNISLICCIILLVLINIIVNCSSGKKNAEAHLVQHIEEYLVQDVSFTFQKNQSYNTHVYANNNIALSGNIFISNDMITINDSELKYETVFSHFIATKTESNKITSILSLVYNSDNYLILEILGGFTNDMIGDYNIVYLDENENATGVSSKLNITENGFASETNIIDNNGNQLDDKEYVVCLSTNKYGDNVFITCEDHKYTSYKFALLGKTLYLSEYDSYLYEMGEYNYCK